MRGRERLIQVVTGGLVRQSVTPNRRQGGIVRTIAQRPSQIELGVTKEAGQQLAIRG